MTYTEKSEQLALEASVAVLVLLGTAPRDAEFIPLKPRMADGQTLDELKARWPGRGLRSVGVMGLCGTAPRAAFKEPLEPEQVSTLMDVFLEYLHSLFCDSFAAVEVAELERLWLLPDTRN